MSARSSTVGPAPLRRIATTPVLADAFGDFVAERAQLGCEPLARLDFAPRELGIAVEVVEQRRQPVAVVGRDVVAQCRVGGLRSRADAKRDRLRSGGQWCA